MKVKSIVKEEIIIDYGGFFDKTKAVSPDIVQFSPDLYRLYYIGTNCLPNERKGYRILIAESKDGRNFVKKNKPLLELSSPDHKHYSPKVLFYKDKYILYYALGAKGKYIIKSAISKDGKAFTPRDGVNIDTKEQYKAAVHSPKLFVDQDIIHCYFTGSNDSHKIFSKKYPKYDFGSNFRLFYTTSQDTISFKEGETISLETPNLVNVYGHNVYYKNGRVFLVFTGFDGSINRIYISVSDDKVNFSQPRILLEPDSNKNELGLYSTSLLSLLDNQFRLFYGIRYFDNHWRICSAKLELN